MSGSGLIDLSPKPPVKPTVPGTLAPVVASPNGTPNNTPVATPAIPSTTPPNVDGGSASFSDLTGSINDLLRSKQAAIASSVDALKANQQVDASTQAAISGIQTDVLGAYHNIERTESLPGGVDGKIAKIFSLFDSDYNINLQQTRIQENQLRANQIIATGDAQKTQNNALPAIMDKVTEAAQAGFNAQRDANTLAISAGHLKVEQFNAKVGAARLNIELSAERRAQVEFAIRSMSTDQLSAAYDLAKQGKGPFKDAAGLVQDRLVSEQASMVALHSAQNAAAQGDREGYNNYMSDFMGHLPADLIRRALETAQKAGQSVVTFNLGIDPATKQPKTLQVPIPIVEAGLVKNKAIEDQANAAVAADDTQRLNLIPNATALIGGANGLASVDPRATSIVTNTTGILQGLDPKNPNSVRQTATMIDNQKALLDGIAKEVSNKFGSPDAKAAVVHYSSTGNFDGTGGTAVVVDSIGIPALNTQTLYRGAFTQLNTLLATAIQAQNVSGTGGFDPTKAGDAQAILAAMLQKPNGKETMSRLSAEILANPANQAPIAKQIAGVVRADTINNTLQGLAHQQNANPIWKDIVEHPEQFMSYALDAGGKPTNHPVLDYQKLFQTFERHSIQTGGKINYSDAFLKAMRAYSTNADNQPSTDPRKTIYDAALEGAIFNGRPHQAVIGDFIGALAQQAARAHADMQARIQQDLTGKTQRDAVVLTNGPEVVSELGPLDNIISPSVVKDKNLTMRLQQVPSATGIPGVTAEDIKKMYGGGH